MSLRPALALAFLLALAAPAARADDPAPAGSDAGAGAAAPAGTSAAAGSGADAMAATPTAAAEAPTPAPAAAPAAFQGVWTALEGPAGVTLGAEAFLSLPEQWTFIPRDQLHAYFGDGERRAGNWDLGVARGPGGAPELRLQFEPLGSVNDASGLEEPLALLARVQQASEAENARRRLSGQEEITVTGWSQAPAYELGAHRLLFGEIRSQNGEERFAWRLRLPGRAGVLKIDLTGPSDSMQGWTVAAAQLAQGLTFLPERGLEFRQPGDKVAVEDLNALVVEGVFGHPGPAGGSQRGSAPVGAWIVGTAFLAAALAFGSVSGMRRLREWRRQRERAEAREQEELELEKRLGTSGDDVEELTEEEAAEAAAAGTPADGAGAGPQNG